MMKFIKHSEINNNTLLKIIELKITAWPYSQDEHLRWINNNLKPEDFHVLLYDNEELVAYLNLVYVFVESFNKNISFFGIGNVCSKYRGRGDGKKLMAGVNSFLLKNDLHGLLFCKENLIEFYNKNDWTIIHNLYPKESIFTMIYNYEGSTVNFHYKDRLF